MLAAAAAAALAAAAAAIAHSAVLRMALRPEDRGRTADGLALLQPSGAAAGEREQLALAEENPWGSRRSRDRCL
jgi:hypothetical protein